MTKEQLDAEAVRIAAERVDRILEKLTDVYPDITVVQARIFMRIAAHYKGDGEDPLTLRELWTEGGFTASTASRTVALLSKVGTRFVKPGLGLITLATNVMNRRERDVALTAKGKRLLLELWKLCGEG